MPFSRDISCQDIFDVIDLTENIAPFTAELKYAIVSASSSDSSCRKYLKIDGKYLLSKQALPECTFAGLYLSFLPVEFTVYAYLFYLPPLAYTAFTSQINIVLLFS